MKKSIFLLVLIIVVGVSIWSAFNRFNTHELSESQKNEIKEITYDYYKSLEAKQFEQALSYCEIDEKDNNFNLDIRSRVISLRELWENIYVVFKTEGSTIEVQYDKDENSYATLMSYEIKYKNTIGGATKDILYFKKINGRWKIVKIKSLDRYVIFRSGRYNVERAVSFLSPILKQN